MDVKESQVGDMAVQEFIFPVVDGVPIRQKHVFGCFAKDYSYVDIHLSKVKFTPQDEALFAAFLNAAHFTGQNAADAAGAGPDSSYYFGEGSKYFLNNGFAQAVGPYRKALDLEKKNLTLDVAVWRQLIDNLGTAYRKIGDLKSAEEVFQYGISSDRAQPLFYYNLACVSADRNDLKEAMKRLQIAFSLQRIAAALGPRPTITAPEPMPDPRKDPCFERFLQDKKFSELLDSF
jgi:tetratricopeptide (TPR) repeat protein